MFCAATFFLKFEKEQIKWNTAEMSVELKRLLNSEIEAFRQREKHRSAEMIAIFAKHNFYANGFTPRELRTTLEDLGPTYVKIGQVMSSRVDLLPPRYCKELEKLRESVKPLDAAVAKGELSRVRDWLSEKVFSIASLTTPDEWVRAITGEGLNVGYYLDYLEEKFSKLYGLK